jgi:hypothetical protein
MGWLKRLHWDAVTKKQEDYQGGFKNKDSGFREGGQWFCPTCFTGFPLEADRGDQRQGGKCVLVSPAGVIAGGGAEKTPAGDYSINTLSNGTVRVWFHAANPRHQ